MAVGEARVPILHDDRRPAHGVDKAAGRGAHSGLRASTVVLTSLAAGAAAGALAKTAIAPLDRTKINFQTSQTPYSWRAATAFIARSARAGGPRALWRGNSATMARIVPYAAVQFTAHEQWKRLMGVDSPATAQAHPVALLTAGSLAGVTSQSATYPLDVARARMAVAGGAATLRATLRDAWREGPRTLYRGYFATVLGVIPYAGVSFFTYDTLKYKYLELSGAAASGPWAVAFGGCAGALGQSASYPLDIVRRRMQTARRRATGDYPCPTTWGTLLFVYRTEGWRGFFKGLSMNWVKGPIAVGISFATYDSFRSTLRDVAVKFEKVAYKRDT